MQRYDEALAGLNRAIELNPGYAWALASRGETYRLMKRYDEALADLDRSVELNPGYARAIAMRGITCLVMNRYDKALADLGRAIELNPGGLATGTPQTFPVASRTCSNTLPGSSRRNRTRRDAPRPAPIRQI